MKILKAIHTFYGVIVFSILFFIVFPFLLVPILFPKKFRWVGVVNRWWARGLFSFIGIPFKVEYRAKLDHSSQYIFCPNHFSYLDIPTLGLNHHNTIFVGKSEMEKIPLFGFMYRSLHITVDRAKLRSRYSTMVRTLEAIDQGKSLVIFPEGGIVTEHDPILARFKDGAFRASIEKQIPIVPVTIPYNWIILPANEFLVRWRPIRVIFHEPIDPSNYTLKDIEQYKQLVRDIIVKELDKHLKT
jgi:1-acyl-sn-glycerol-3-phosphate acyltransferase